MSNHKVSVQGRDLTVKHDVGTEVFQLSSAREAVAAAKWILAQGDVEAVFSCGWLVEAAPVWASDPDSDWYPDSPADLIRECGAVVVGTAKGWHGMCGHSHVSGAQYYEEDEVVAYRQAGHPIAPNALLMDGRSVSVVR